MLAIFLFSSANWPGFPPSRFLGWGRGGIKHVERRGNRPTPSRFKVCNAFYSVHTRPMKHQ
jgi:hypothetical protein